MSVHERGTRSRHSSILRQDNMGIIPQRASNSRPSRPISLDLDEMSKFTSVTQHETDENFPYEDGDPIAKHPMVEEDISENRNSRARRRESKTGNSQ